MNKNETLREDIIPYVAKFNPNYKYHLDIRYEHCVSCSGILLHQIGDLAMHPAADMDKHTNTVYEFTYVLEGKGVVITGDHRYDVAAGDCILSVPGEVHYIRSDETVPLRYAFTAFLFPAEDLRYRELQEALNRIRDEKSSRLANVIAMRELFLQMFVESQNTLPYKWDHVGLLLGDMIIRFLRAHSGITEPAYWNLTDKNALAYKIRTYLNMHFLQLDQLTDLETIFHYKYPSIESVFKETFGETLFSYLTKLKMEEAVRLISSGVSITKTSELLRYSSIHSFTRSFRNYYGASPTKFLNT